MSYRISIISPDGALLRRWSLPCSGSMTVDAEGNVYLVGYNQYWELGYWSIHKFDREGNPVFDRVTPQGYQEVYCVGDRLLATAAGMDLNSPTGYASTITTFSLDGAQLAQRTLPVSVANLAYRDGYFFSVDGNSTRPALHVLDADLNLLVTAMTDLQLNLQALAVGSGHIVYALPRVQPGGAWQIARMQFQPPATLAPLPAVGVDYFDPLTSGVFAATRTGPARLTIGGDALYYVTTEPHAGRYTVVVPCYQLGDGAPVRRFVIGLTGSDAWPLGQIRTMATAPNGNLYILDIAPPQPACRLATAIDAVMGVQHYLYIGLDGSAFHRRSSIGGAMSAPVRVCAGPLSDLDLALGPDGALRAAVSGTPVCHYLSRDLGATWRPL